MSLKEALEKKPADPRRRCGVKSWIDTLPTDEQEAAALLLASSRRTTDVHDAFTGEGYPLQYVATLRHRNGRCSCELGR